MLIVAVTALAEQKADFLLIFGMQEVLPEVAHFGIRRLIDADQVTCFGIICPQ
jgi:hypothetical protein